MALSMAFCNGVRHWSGVPSQCCNYSRVSCCFASLLSRELKLTCASRWSSTNARGRMIAAVFLMQPVGQLFAYLVGFCVLIGLDKRDHIQENCSKTADAAALAICTSTVDSIWRIVTGVGERLPSLPSFSAC